jgi:serine/threonine-protein kinase
MADEPAARPRSATRLRAEAPPGMGLEEGARQRIGRYEIIKTIGKGAMGIVYKAVDPAIDREVAIKTIKVALEEEELALYEARFAQEIKTVGKLNHPHIVPIYDVGRTEHFAYMAMEFIDGHELKAYMMGAKPLHVATAVDLVAQVADGLAFAHTREIVHRDIKPSNIMVAMSEERLVAKVMDFGIARAPSSKVKTQTGMIVGSPRYMSPEQVIGKNIGPRSDVFSLGVVLYEMLTGIAPFDADTVSSIMYQTVHVREEPCSKANADVPPPLDAIVAKALAKNPDERYATMKDFYRALRETLKGLPEPIVLAIPEVVVPVRPVDTDVAIADGDRPRTLSNSFSSLAGTRRLAELTGGTEDPGITMFLKRNPDDAPKRPTSATSTGTMRDLLAQRTGALPPPAKRPFPVGPAALLGTLGALAVALGIALVL